MHKINHQNFKNARGNLRKANSYYVCATSVKSTQIGTRSELLSMDYMYIVQYIVQEQFISIQECIVQE